MNTKPFATKDHTKPIGSPRLALLASGLGAAAMAVLLFGASQAEAVVNEPVVGVPINLIVPARQEGTSISYIYKGNKYTLSQAQYNTCKTVILPDTKEILAPQGYSRFAPKLPLGLAVTFKNAKGTAKGSCLAKAVASTAPGKKK